MLTPMNSFIAGKPQYDDKFGRGSDLRSGLVLVTELRDDSGPIATPAGYLVPYNALIFATGGEVFFDPASAIATWDGTEFTSTANFVYSRVVGAVERPTTDAFTNLFMVEALESKGPISAGNLYVVPFKWLYFLDENYVYFEYVDAIAESDGGW